jgi:four helix bundle protein
MSKSIIQQRSFKFAVEITELCRSLRRDEREFVLTSPLLRSGTSIGANVREALNGQSVRDFIYKMTVAQKECDETRYWLELLLAADFVPQTEYEILHAEATQLLKMIRSIVLTTKSKQLNERSPGG